MIQSKIFFKSPSVTTAEVEYAGSFICYSRSRGRGSNREKAALNITSGAASVQKLV